MKWSDELNAFAKKIFAADTIIIVIAIILDLGFGTDQFGEMGIVTILSVALLLLASWLTYRIFLIRYQGGFSLKVSATLWGVISFGCIFLAADEFLKIHENLDEYIHVVFEWQETALSDRLDDLLILVYMAGALVIMSFYRNELLRFRRLWPWLATGFGMATVMVCLDALTNREDILPLFLDPKPARIVHLGICGTEDILKIAAITTFVLMFFRAREMAREMAEPSETSL